MTKQEPDYKALKLALELAREMLIENREYIELYERPKYLALYDKAISRIEQALSHAFEVREQPAQGETK